MKKIILCSLLLACVLLTGCVRGYFWLDQKTPHDFNDSKWVSEVPKMWFTVEITYKEPTTSQYINSPERNNIGQLTYEGRVYDISVEFDVGHFLVKSFIDGEWKLMFSGTFIGNSKQCTFMRDKWDGVIPHGSTFDEFTIYRTE